MDELQKHEIRRVASSIGTGSAGFVGVYSSSPSARSRLPFNLSLAGRKKMRKRRGARSAGAWAKTRRRRTTTTTTAMMTTVFNSPFFFAIVTTLRVPEVETADDRKGAAMVMRVPHTEDLRRADIGLKPRVAREGKKETKKEVRREFFLPFFSVVVIDSENNSIETVLFRTLRASTGPHDAATAAIDPRH